MGLLTGARHSTFRSPCWRVCALPRVDRLLEESAASLAEGNFEHAKHWYANAQAYTALKAKLAGLAATQWQAHEADAAALREEIRSLKSEVDGMRNTMAKVQAEAEAKAEDAATSRVEVEAKA